MHTYNSNSLDYREKFETGMNYMRSGLKQYQQQTWKQTNKPNHQQQKNTSLQMSEQLQTIT